MASLANMVARLTPADLPVTPWVLKSAPGVGIGKSYFRGGPFLTVRDNVVWLRELQRDVRAGRLSPRAITGAVQEDMRALATTLVLGAG